MLQAILWDDDGVLVVVRNALMRGHAFPGAYRVVDTMPALPAEIEPLLAWPA